MSADEFNSFQEAAQFVRAERTRRGASDSIGNTTDRTQPLVVSESSTSIRAFSTVKITGIQEKPSGGPTDDFISLTPLKVDKPTGTDESFLIVQDGLPEQGMAARALTDGITPAWVTFDSGNETTAGPAENSFDLKAGGTGAEILWKPDGTGSLLCVVRIGNGNSNNFVLAQLTSTLSAEGTATADIYSWPEGESPTKIEEGKEVSDWLLEDEEEIASDKKVLLVKIGGRYIVAARFPGGNFEEQDITYVHGVSCVDDDIVGSTTTKTVLVPASEG